MLNIPARLERSALTPLLVYGGISAVMLVRMGPPILILVVPFGAAYLGWLGWGRHRPAPWTGRLGTWYVPLMAAQPLHFTEEFLTGFRARSPRCGGRLWPPTPRATRPGTTAPSWPATC